MKPDVCFLSAVRCDLRQRIPLEREFRAYGFARRSVWNLLPERAPFTMFPFILGEAT
jgi:hypothetical protein